MKLKKAYLWPKQRVWRRLGPLSSPCCHPGLLWFAEEGPVGVDWVVVKEGGGEAAVSSMVVNAQAER
jgi:hypothetical protein